MRRRQAERVGACAQLLDDARAKAAVDEFTKRQRELQQRARKELVAQLEPDLDEELRTLQTRLRSLSGSAREAKAFARGVAAARMTKRRESAPLTQAPQARRFRERRAEMARASGVPWLE